MRSLGKSKKPLVQRHPKVFAAPASAKKTPSKLAAPLPGDICKYMYIYVYVCMYIFIFISIKCWRRMPLQRRLAESLLFFASCYVYICAYTYIYMYIHKYIYIHIYICLSMYVCLYMYILGFKFYAVFTAPASVTKTLNQLAAPSSADTHINLCSYVYIFIYIYI